MATTVVPLPSQNAVGGHTLQHHHNTRGPQARKEMVWIFSQVPPRDFLEFEQEHYPTLVLDHNHPIVHPRQHIIDTNIEAFQTHAFNPSTLSKTPLFQLQAFETTDSHYLNADRRNNQRLSYSHRGEILSDDARFVPDSTNREYFQKYCSRR